MRTPRPTRIRRWSLIAILALLISGTATAQAETPTDLVATAFPSANDPGMPFYARIEPAAPHVFDDGELAVIVFYRSPTGIPTDFDLLTFFDPPAAFGVESHITGTSLWHGAFNNGAPYEVTSRGTGALPIWFVPIAPLRAAIAANGRLTLPDIVSIDGIVAGTAEVFEEVLHPHANPPELGGGGHPHPAITISAAGTLEDGRTFEIMLVNMEGAARSTRIDFR